MAVYKNISSQVIIRKVLRDLKPNNANWIDDAIEWIGEALEHIGASSQLETKNLVLNVKDYKVALPNDLYYINQVAVNNYVTPATKAELKTINTKLDEIKALIDSNPNQQLYSELRDLTSRMIVLQSMYFSTSNNRPLEPLAYGTATFMRSLHCDKCVNETALSKEWYIVENGLIKTSFKSGEICLSYTAFPIDEDCYPLVPDDVSFKEAMFWYIFKQLLLGGFDKPGNKFDYTFADTKWKYYCTQARNTANYPDIDRMESFMNQWVRLIPDINRAEDFFDHLGDRETLYRS